MSRFTVTKTDPPRIDPASEEIVLTFLQGGHNGGDLHFGPDGMLYISTGDAASPNPPDPLNTGQDISDLLSSILRIDVDRKDEGKNYAVPKDNPFVGMKGARPEVWAYGFRNPWRMSFDRQTGELFVGDVGWELWEMVHRVEKGGNYGWSAMEGPQPIKPEQVGPTPIHPALIELPHTIACSVTGGYVYRGKKFPELRGAYVFGDWETRRLWAARFEGDRTKEMPEIARPSVRIVAFGEDNDGELYFLDHDGGTVHTLERNDGGAAERRLPDDAVADRPVRLGQGPHAGGRRDPVRGEQPAVAGRRDGGALGRLPGRVVRHPARDRQADPRPGVLAQLPHALPQGRGAGADPLAGRPAAGDAAPALRRRGLARLHLRLARRSDRRRPRPRRRRREGSARSASRSASGSSTAAASACRATATSRNTRWRSSPSS